MTKNNIEFSKEAAISYLKLCGCKLDDPEELYQYIPNAWSVVTSETHNEYDGRQRVNKSEITAKYNPADNSVEVINRSSESTNTIDYEDSDLPCIATRSLWEEKKSVFTVLKDGSDRLLIRRDQTADGYYKGDNYGGEMYDCSSNPLSKTEIIPYIVPDDFSLLDGINEGVKSVLESLKNFPFEGRSEADAPVKKKNVR